MRKDVFVVVLSLALIALAGIVGFILLSYAGKPVDTALVALVSTAVGALASLLARTGSGDAPKDEGKVDPPPAVLNGAAKVVGLALVLALGSSVSACSWLRSGNHAKDIASILTCISGEAAAGKSPGEIAVTCGLQSADEVIDLVTRSQGVAAAAPKMAKPASSSSSSGSK
jgi:hypothetical protein